MRGSSASVVVMITVIGNEAWVYRILVIGLRSFTKRPESGIYTIKENMEANMVMNEMRLMDRRLIITFKFTAITAETAMLVVVSYLNGDRPKLLMLVEL